MSSVRIVPVGTMLLVLALACAAFPESGAAQKRLWPPEAQEGPLAEHRATVREVLKEIYRPDIRLRAVVQPSFRLEYAVGLRQTATGHEIVTLRPAEQIWTYQVIERMKSGHMGRFRSTGDDSGSLMGGELVDVTAEEIERLQKAVPENPADLPVSRCSVPVDGESAAVLLRAWRRMLVEVRPGEKALPGLDGTSYSFAIEEGGDSLVGDTWSPRRGTRPARLAAITDALYVYCEKPEPAAWQRILKLARSLGGRS